MNFINLLTVVYDRSHWYR